jgi:hypothetical protein
LNKVNVNNLNCVVPDVANSNQLLDRKESRLSTISRVEYNSINLTLMLISTSFLYVIGNAPYSVYYISTRIFYINPRRIKTLFTISQISIYLLITLKAFVYYSFNKVFRKQFNSYVYKMLPRNYF